MDPMHTRQRVTGQVVEPCQEPFSAPPPVERRTNCALGEANGIEWLHAYNVKCKAGEALVSVKYSRGNCQDSRFFQYIYTCRQVGLYAVSDAHTTCSMAQGKTVQFLDKFHTSCPDGQVMNGFQMEPCDQKVVPGESRYRITCGKMKTACATTGCIGPVLDARPRAGGPTCGAHIHALRTSKHMTELDACMQIAGRDFPEVCGGCDPTGYADKGEGKCQTIDGFDPARTDGFDPSHDYFHEASGSEAEFNELDKNNDGALSRDEFLQQFPDDGAEFDIADKCSPGELTYETITTLRALCAPHPPEVGSITYKAMPCGPGNQIKWVSMATPDPNCKWSSEGQSEQWVRDYTGTCGVPPAIRLVSHMPNQFPSQCQIPDGLLSKEEYEAAFGKEGKNGAPSIEECKGKCSADSNCAGYSVSKKDNCLLYMLPARTPFEAVDKDKDGSLSRDEFVKVFGVASGANFDQSDKCSPGELKVSGNAHIEELCAPPGGSIPIVYTGMPCGGDGRIMWVSVHTSKPGCSWRSSVHGRDAEGLEWLNKYTGTCGVAPTTNPGIPVRCAHPDGKLSKEEYEAAFGKMGKSPVHFKAGGASSVDLKVEPEWKGAKCYTNHNNCDLQTVTHTTTTSNNDLCGTAAGASITYKGIKCSSDGRVLWESMATGSNAACSWNAAGKGSAWLKTYIGTCGVAPTAVPDLPTHVQSITC